MCLAIFDYPLVLEFEEEYFPISDTTDVCFRETCPDEADYFTIDEHQVIDLTEAIRQYVLISVPMKPLCREDCTGL